MLLEYLDYLIVVVFFGNLDGSLPILVFRVDICSPIQKEIYDFHPSISGSPV